jgi:hypothetical protein
MDICDRLQDVSNELRRPKDRWRTGVKVSDLDLLCDWLDEAKAEIERLRAAIGRWQIATQFIGTHRSCTCVECERLMAVNLD